MSDNLDITKNKNDYEYNRRKMLDHYRTNRQHETTLQEYLKEDMALGTTKHTQAEGVSGLNVRQTDVTISLTHKLPLLHFQTGTKILITQKSKRFQIS